MKQRKNTYGFGVVGLILILAVVIVIGLAGYLVYKNHHKMTTTSVATTKPTTTTKTAPTTSTTTSNTYAGWQQYCSTSFGACFKYPSDWSFDKCPNPPRAWQDGCDADSVVIVNPANTTTVNFDLDYDNNPNTCNASQTSYPGLTYSDVTAVPNIANLYYVNMNDGYNELGGYEIKLTLLNGNNGQPPVVGQTGSLCPTIPIFKSTNGQYWVQLYAIYDVNTSPGQDNSVPTQSDEAIAKQILLSFHYQ